jgi:hypothetical protein
MVDSPYWDAYLGEWLQPSTVALRHKIAAEQGPGP